MAWRPPLGGLAIGMRHREWRARHLRRARAQPPKWTANARWENGIANCLADAEFGRLIVRQGRFAFSEPPLEPVEALRIAVRRKVSIRIFEGGCHWNRLSPLATSTTSSEPSRS